MRCIYCLEDSSRSKGIPHVVPEGIIKNDLVLPVGAICDSCNHYLGHELDSVMASHPLISLFAQFMAFPGKTGKPRRKLGNVERHDEPRTISSPIQQPTFLNEPDGARSGTVTIVVPRNFSLTRFRRGLYHIGLNTVAERDGVEAAHDARYDPARAYVRQPKRAERRPFIQYANLAKRFTPTVSVLLATSDGMEVAALTLARAAVFAVDLLDVGGLQAWGQRELPPGSMFVDVHEDLPRERPASDGMQYRISICSDR